MLTILIIMRGFSGASSACFVSLCASPAANYLCDYPPASVSCGGSRDRAAVGIQHVRDWSTHLDWLSQRSQLEEGRGSGKRIWRSEIGSGMLLANFHTLMLFEYPRTYAQKMYMCTCVCAHTHIHSWEPHPSPILLFSSALRLLSSLLHLRAAKLSPEKLNNHKSFQLADELHFFFKTSEREGI